jgi:hypothetical protein
MNLHQRIQALERRMASATVLSGLGPFYALQEATATVGGLHTLRCRIDSGTLTTEDLLVLDGLRVYVASPQAWVRESDDAEMLLFPQ